MWRHAALYALLAVPAAAEGFAVRDLTGIEQAARSALGADYIARAAPSRLTLVCADCPSSPMVDLLLDRQADGTEGRVRSGATSMADLQALCQAREPACRIEAVQAPPAVAWISSYPAGSRAGNTLVVLRDGDLLTLRSVATDPVVARRNADALIAAVVPRIIGK